MTERTRRAALVMMAGGATLLATETAGFTRLGSLREFDVGVAPDSEASLRIEGVDTEAEPGQAVYISPFTPRFVNRRNQEVELTVTSDEFDVRYLDEEGEPIQTDSITLAAAVSDPDPDDPRPDIGVVEGSIDPDEDETITGSAQIQLEGPSFSLEFERTFSLVNPLRTENLNLFYNTYPAGTVRNPAGNLANNNQTVDRWIRRDESLENIDMRGDGGIRPRLQTSGINARPAIEFTGTEQLMTRADDGTNLGTNLRRDNTPKQANIFFVFRPISGTTTTGDREIIRLHQNDNNTIRYRRNPGTLTAVLQGTQRSITNLTTPTNATHVLTLRFRRDGNNVLLDARRNGSQVGSTQNFGDVLLPDQPVVRIGSPNNAAAFDTMLSVLRIYHADQGTDGIEAIESMMMDNWGIN